MHHHGLMTVTRELACDWLGGGRFTLLELHLKIAFATVFPGGNPMLPLPYEQIEKTFFRFRVPPDRLKNHSHI